jgi:hypothetical protein
MYWLLMLVRGYRFFSLSYFKTSAPGTHAFCRLGSGLLLSNTLRRQADRLSKILHRFVDGKVILGVFSRIVT